MYKHTKSDHHHLTDVITSSNDKLEFRFSDWNAEKIWLSVWDDAREQSVMNPLTLQDLKELRKAINQEIKLLTEADHE